MAKKILVSEADFLDTQNDLALFFEQDHGEHAQALLADYDQEITINICGIDSSTKNLDIIFTGDGLFFSQLPSRQNNAESSLPKKKRPRKPFSLPLL
jgi:hypothetical protein